MVQSLFLPPRSKKTQAAMLILNPPAAPPTMAAAAVLGQTGLWGSLMGGPDTSKAVEEETESTDGEDEVRGVRIER